MAVRVSHTNNSSGHDGTYVYRSTSPMDPQSLPAPIADEAPVALGATFEYIDDPADGTYYYRAQDHEGGQVSAVSDEVSIVIGEDLSSAQAGDEVGGGIYAGIITYSDSRQFHIIFGKQSSETTGLRWGEAVVSGADSPDDGSANQDIMLTTGDTGESEAFYYCRDYVDAEQNNDYYLPAKNEIILADSLVDASHPEFSADLSTYRLTSTEEQGTVKIFIYKLSDSTMQSGSYKTNASLIVRPIRRVPV